MKREDRRAGAFTRRALLLGAGQLGIFGALAAKLYQVQVVEGARYATLSDNNRISARLIAPPRGRVLDREAGTDSSVALPCGSTRGSVCPACADKAAGSASSSAPKAGIATPNPNPPTSPTARIRSMVIMIRRTA